MTAPVGIVGAGVVGVACARALQRAGRTVVLFDPAPPGSVCSFGNAGQIAIDHVRPLSRPDVLAGVPRMLADPLGPLALRWRGVPGLSPWLARFALAARPGQVRTGTGALAVLLAGAVPAWQAMLQEAGLADLLRQQGSLTLFETARTAAAAAAEGRIMAAHGVVFEDLPGPAAHALAPGLRQAPVAGRLFPQAAHVVNPFRLVQDLAARAVADGATLVTEPVQAFRRDGGRIAALVTPSGETAVSDVVLTAGLGSVGLAGLLGVHLPLTAERGYHAMLPLGALDVTMPTSFSERGFIVTPMAHGVRLAGTVELGHGGGAPDWARADILTTQVRQLFGVAVDPTDRWQGDRPTLPDYVPALGRVPGLGNVVAAVGHQHLGLTLAAVSANVVARLLAGEPPGLDLAPFAPDRFTRGGSLAGRAA